MGLLVINDNLLTALGITNEDQFNQTFSDFSDFEDFLEKADYTYKFDEDSNLILVTPKSKEINTGIKIQREEPVPTPGPDTKILKFQINQSDNPYHLPTSYKITSDYDFWYNTDGSDNYSKYKGETIVLNESNVLQIFETGTAALNFTPYDDNYILTNHDIRETDLSFMGRGTCYMPQAIIPNINIVNIQDPTYDVHWTDGNFSVDPDYSSAAYHLVDENNQPVEPYDEISSDSLAYREVGTLHGTFTGVCDYNLEIYEHFEDLEHPEETETNYIMGANFKYKCSVTFP